MKDMQTRDGSQMQRGRGRPRVEEPRASVSTWIPAHLHDRLIEVAKREEQSISATVRQLLILRLQP